MKKTLLLSILFFTIIICKASAFIIPDSIGVKKADGKKYIIHRVDSAEGWFSIARLYGVSYASLRLANKDSSDKLIPGQSILVPADKLKPNDPHFDKNYIQDRADVFYSVKEGETLFSIAKRFSTSVDSLKIWNHLADTGLKAGKRLKVGTKNKNEQEEPTVAVVKKDVKTKNSVRDSSVELKGIPEKLNVKSDTAKPVNETDTPTSIKKNNSVTSNASNPSPVSDSTKIVKTASVLKTETKKSASPVISKIRKEVVENGVASWIRDDDVNPNKYYALHRSASIGTIIKVINKMNNRYVFVKVVGLLPDTGDNNDLVIKISKASAEKLGVRDSRFQCELNYGVTEKP